MRRNLTILMLLTFFLISPQIEAQDYGASLKISTLGITVEGIRSFGETVNVRLGASFFGISQDGGGGTDDYEYTADASLTSLHALADWFAFGGSTFRITGGFMINLNKLDLDMVPTETYTVGGDIYGPENIGNMKAKIDFGKFAPYIGIGIGNPMAGDSGLKFVLDVGTAYQGSPNIDLTATGLLEPSAAPDQEATLESNLDWFKWYPVLSLGLVYKF